MYKSYKDLKVWQKAHEFVKDVYSTNFKFPNDERFGLQSQLKRAVISIPANIVEGASRQYDKEFKQFLFIAKGSLNETDYYLLLCRELDYLSKEDYMRLMDKCNHINKMLSSLIARLT